MSKDWRVYAQHIVDCADKLRRISVRGDITTDDILYDAALRNLQTLAEATQQLPDSIKAEYPAIEWKKIGGFRNIIVHNYLGDIDPQTIDRVLTTHVRPLVAAAQAMLKAGS